MLMKNAERRRKVFLEVRSVWGEESGLVRDESLALRLEEEGMKTKFSLMSRSIYI